MQQQLTLLPRDICLSSSLTLLQHQINSGSMLKNTTLKKTLQARFSLLCFTLFTTDVVNIIQPFCYLLSLTYKKFQSSFLYIE